MKLNKIMAVMVISSALVLSGCSAMGTAIKKRNLDVKTQMSETIWLEPSNNKTVYLQIKNTSDKDMSGLQSKITSTVTAKGYQVVTNPDTAGYWIQANVLKADKMDLRETQGWLSRGYEGAATAAALGAGITAYNSSSAGATLGVGLAAGLVDKCRRGLHRVEQRTDDFRRPRAARQPYPKRQADQHTKQQCGQHQRQGYHRLRPGADSADGDQRNQRRRAHADAGNLPGNQRENNNRHRRRHAQQQLLEGAQDVIHRYAYSLE